MAKETHFSINQLGAPTDMLNKFFLDNYKQCQTTIKLIQTIQRFVKTNQLKFNEEHEITKRSNVNMEEDHVFVEPSIVKLKHGKSEALTSLSTEDSGSDDITLVELTRSSKSQRSAAQAAGHKIAHVQNLMKTKKLRRPTEFDKHQSRRGDGSSPPAKSRKTRRKQSAGSSSSQDTDGLPIGSDFIKPSQVIIKPLSNSEIKFYTRQSRSLEGLKRKSCDLFGEEPKVKQNGKQSSLVILSDNQDEELLNLVVNVSPISEAQLKRLSFKKDDIKENKPLLSDNTKEVHSDSEVVSLNTRTLRHKREMNDKMLRTTIVGKHANQESQLIRQHERLDNVSDLEKPNENPIEQNKSQPIQMLTSIHLQQSTDNNSVENYKISEVAYDSSHASAKPKVEGMESGEIETLGRLTQMDNKALRNRVHSDNSESDLSDTCRRRTRIIKINNEAENPEVESQAGTKTVSSETKVRSRTKAIKKNDESNSPEIECQTETKPPCLENKIRTRTKTIKKNDETESPEVESQTQTKCLTKVPKSGAKSVNSKHSDPSSNGSEEESDSEIVIRSRTRVIKKVVNEFEAPVTNLSNNTDDTRNLNQQSEEQLYEKQNNKSNKENHPSSPIPSKGDLVKKRIEGFETLFSLVGKVEDVPSGRITRLAAKKAPSTVHVSKVTRNNKVVSRVELLENKVFSSERPKLMPLASQNRMTPASDFKLLTVNKGISSGTRPITVENSEAYVQKQALEEENKKKKEEERLKRQAKEETAKKKKEKALKATAEEAKRKREEKLQRVAATREAAEREKQILALKAEKEREEKMQQIAAEKEKQKEEQLKKKQLAQQKLLEHEERRKQEEEARLAKLREQEEEHKRILAMKEREAEQKKNRAAELRLAEAEKIKHMNQGSKLCKQAVVNNASAILQQTSKAAHQQGVQSYEITPAREDRSPAEPKSEDDYGIEDAKSDDSSDDETRPKKKIPRWAQSTNRNHVVRLTARLPETIWTLFMESNVCTAQPDVNQIFAGIKLKKRTRTSSAVWNTPPRFF